MADNANVQRQSSGVVWKLAAIVFGTSTVVLAILLSGQLATPAPTAAPPATLAPTESIPGVTPEQASPISDSSQLVGSLGLTILQNYPQEAGWPAAVTVEDGMAVASDGFEIGPVPDDIELSYEVAADGSTFTLTLVDSTGTPATFGSPPPVG